MTAGKQLEFTLNGVRRSVEVEPRTTLADLLRDGLGLTGTHLGCEQGICGACTVLVDGRSTRACTTLAVQVQDSPVWTVEGLSPAEGLSCLQRSFQEHHGLQCGFCTPGLIVTATELLVRYDGRVTEEQVREEIGGNICRCTGYESIVDAVLAVAPEEVADLPGAGAVAHLCRPGDLTAVPQPTALDARDAAHGDGPDLAAGGGLPLWEAVQAAACFLLAFVAGAVGARALRRPRRRA